MQALVDHSSFAPAAAVLSPAAGPRTARKAGALPVQTSLWLVPFLGLGLAFWAGLIALVV